jgi:hypothetical protein
MGKSADMVHKSYLQQKKVALKPPRLRMIPGAMNLADYKRLGLYGIQVIENPIGLGIGIPDTCCSFNEY